MRVGRYAAQTAAGLMIATAACGGRSNDGTPVSPTPPGTGASTATVTITAAGVSPRELTVAAGSRVTFVNNDSRSHEMTSDPHPEHTDCPELNVVGFLLPNQSRQTANLTTIRTCGYHDHLRETDRALQGTIRVE